jgi:hypothetical protein
MARFMPTDPLVDDGYDPKRCDHYFVGVSVGAAFVGGRAIVVVAVGLGGVGVAVAGGRGWVAAMVGTRVLTGTVTVATIVEVGVVIINGAVDMRVAV